MIEPTPERASGRRLPPSSRARALAARPADDLVEPTGPPRVVVLHAIESAPWPTRDLLRAGLVLAVVAVLGAGLGYLGSGRLPQKYEARAEVVYELRSELGAGFLRQDRRLSTQIVAMTARANVAKVAAAVGVPTDDLERLVTAAVVGDSEVVRISVVDTDRARAQRIADLVRSTYLDDVDAQASDPELAAERARLAAERADLVRVEADLATRALAVDELPASRRAELTAVRARLDAVSDRERAIDREAQSLRPARALSEAYTLTDPVAPRRGLIAAGAALASLLVAAVLGGLARSRAIRGGRR